MHCKVKLIEKKNIAQDALELKLQKPVGFKFVPGQYIGIKIKNPNSKLSARGGSSFGRKVVKARSLSHAVEVKSFSISSSPKDRFLTTAMRITDSAYKQAILKLRKGSLVDIEGPYGQFTLHGVNSGQTSLRNRDLDVQPAIFIANGVGVTPVRSIIKHASEKKVPYRFLVLASNRDIKTAVYINDLVRWARKNNHFKLKLFYTRINNQTGVRFGDDVIAGRINKMMVGRFIKEYRKPIFYVAGTPNFVFDICEMLRKLKVREENMVKEEFAGY